MKTISIIHPFTPKAAGVVEDSVATYHSQPHLKAMLLLNENEKINCRMEYLTQKRSYGFEFKNIQYHFYSVDFKWNGDHKKWKKQFSKSCLKAYEKHTPDVTIINMSGHSSPFSHELAKLILSKGKQYIPMLGGQHYSETKENIEYYKNAHHILVHTHIQKEAMQQMDMFKGKEIGVFPLGVDVDFFKPDATQKAIHKAPKLLYVGRIVEWKRIHLAIEAIKLLKENGFVNASLKIIGPVSSQEYFDFLKEKVKAYNLLDNVSFLGHKEHNELPSFFKEADLFTLPSDKETFGMVMIEAMACGTPVAAINCPGGPLDVITPNLDGLLSSPEEYSKMILEYFKDTERIKTLPLNARKKAVEDFSIYTTYKVLKNSIEKIL